jgi:hypothetical protein
MKTSLYFGLAAAALAITLQASTAKARGTFPQRLRQFPSWPGNIRISGSVP